MIQIGLQTELAVEEEDFNRALLEAWPDVAERRRAKGFAYQRDLLWSALQKFSVNFFELTDSGKHYCGSIMFNLEPVEINGVEHWFAPCLCVGRDSSGSKSWFAKIESGVAEKEVLPGFQELLPFHYAFCAQPSAPIGQFAIKQAKARGDDLPAYRDYFQDDAADDDSILIARVFGD